MQRYLNLNGDSAVVAYEIGRGSIIVKFDSGLSYEDNDEKPGAVAVAEMQRLAEAGRGLGSYISRVVRKRYARRF